MIDPVPRSVGSQLEVLDSDPRVVGAVIQLEEYAKASPGRTPEWMGLRQILTRLKRFSIYWGSMRESQPPLAAVS